MEIDRFFPSSKICSNCLYLQLEFRRPDNPTQRLVHPKKIVPLLRLSFGRCETK